MEGNHERFGRRLLAVGFWILVWQMGALYVDNHIILVGPWDTVLALGRLIPDGNFWRSVLSSFGKISLGFLSALGAGVVLGSLGYKLAFLRDLLEPVMVLLKSVPVASFVILALIWVGSANLSVLIAFIVVLPMIYVNTLAGLKSTDSKLLEMAKVFRMSVGKKARYIYLPALLPYLKSGCRIALGMSWKSGVAAEVIGVPARSIGEKLYMAKIYLNTGDVLAWTLVIILVSALFERAVLGVLDRLAPGEADMSLAVRDLSKAFENLQVLQGVNLDFKDSGIYCLMGPSGTGKTTFLRILMGLEKADTGVIQGWDGKRFSAVFQEDRLCEAYTPLDNVMMAADRSVTREAARRELCRILPEESVSRPVYTLSGGMKRRTAVCRALLAPYDILVMDEPFAGLDGDTRGQVLRYVREKTEGKLVILSTHMEEDAAVLGAETVRLYTFQ